MKKLYLHIGMPKTGTSALQSFFAKNRERLYEDGIWYPELNAESRVEEKLKAFRGNADFLNSNISFEHMNKEQRQLFVDTCNKLRSSDKDILLSNEGLFQYNETGYKNFVSQGFDVRVIVYLRRQDLWGESVWNQVVKGSDVTESCFDFIKMKDLDYYDKLKGIAAVIGKDNVIVSVYEEGSAGRQKDIFTTFLNILGIYDTENYQKDTYQANPSLSANYVEIKRIFNSIPNGCTFMETMREILEEGRKYALTNEKTVHAPSFLKREERLSIIEKYHESNTMLAREFLGRDTLFDETIEDNDEYGVDHETIYPDIIKFFGTLFVRQYEEMEIIKDALYKFEIPTECIGKRIVIYGIDSLGSRLYRQLESGGICKELMAVDKRWYYVPQWYNIPTVNPEIILYKDIDYVMIAVRNEKTYEAIKSHLINTKNLRSQQILRMRLPDSCKQNAMECLGKPETDNRLEKAKL